MLLIYCNDIMDYALTQVYSCLRVLFMAARLAPLINFAITVFVVASA